jgi:ethanolamine utilization protein EutN
MRLGRVIGNVTLGKKLPEFKGGSLLVVEPFDQQMLRGVERCAGRAKASPESLVVFDELGAGVGQIIAISEGREAAQPFHPLRNPVDAYNAAIVDTIHLTA